MLLRLLFLLFWVCKVVSDETTVGMTGEDGMFDDGEHEIRTKVVLEHSLDMKSFHPRGEFTLATNVDGVSRVVSLVENGFSEQDISDMKSLLASNDLYRIRIRSKVQDKSKEATPVYVSAAVPACDLQKGGFKEEINLHMELDNSIVGVVYSSSRAPSAIARACDPEKVPKDLKFQSRMKVLDMAVSQSVPVIVTGPKPPHLKSVNFGEGDTEKTVVQQSFLRKYWYIILPLAVMLLTGGGGADDGKGAAAPSAAK